MNIEPYLFYEGRCEEAIEFYRKNLGAQVLHMMRYNQSPEPCTDGTAPPGDKIMHVSLQIGGTRIMASDGRCSGKPSFQGFALTINAANDADADRLFAALSDGGQVHMPLTKTFFASRFGMLADRFGVSWMVMVATNN